MFHSAMSTADAQISQLAQLFYMLVTVLQKVLYPFVGSFAVQLPKQRKQQQKTVYRLFNLHSLKHFHLFCYLIEC